MPAIPSPRNSLLGLLTVVAVLAGAAVAPAAAQAPQPQVLVVGDSLAVGLRPFLGGMLADRTLSWDAKSGRTTPQGLAALRAALRHETPQAVVVSLGTNDGWDPRRFADRLTRVLAAIPPQSCVVWPALFRPARKGPYLALNAVLRARARQDPRLVVLNWDRWVTSGRVHLPDGLHPDDAGYQYRSAKIAAAVQHGCSPAIPS